MVVPSVPGSPPILVSHHSLPLSPFLWLGNRIVVPGAWEIASLGPDGGARVQEIDSSSLPS